MTKLRVGFVGSGEVTQLLHLPALNQLREQFTVTALCDVSPATLAKVADHWRIPHRTHDYQRLVLMGLGHRRPALLAYALIAGSGVGAVLALSVGFSLQCVIITMCVFLHLVLGYRIDTAWRRHRIGAQTP